MAKGKGAKAVAQAGGHPGFAALVKAGVPAGALADESRNASPAAKKKNPRLKKVAMPKKSSSPKGGGSRGGRGGY